MNSIDWRQARLALDEEDESLATAVRRMGLRGVDVALRRGDGDSEKQEELCQNLLIVLFTIMWKGFETADEPPWQVFMDRTLKKLFT